MRVYFDNASTTPVLPEVTEKMTEILEHDFGNPSSIHFHGRKARSIIENARKTVAKIIQASVGEVFFTSSATEANNMVLKNAFFDLGIKRFITSPTEHHCVLYSLEYLERRFGCKVLFVKVDDTGAVDTDDLERLLSESTEKTLVSIMHGNNEIGTIADIQRIGALCQTYQALFHCDTVQTMGKYPIDVQASNISFLSGSAHKFHGPKGVGFLYIKSSVSITPYIHGGSQERNMRAGTENVAGIAGLAVALETSIQNMDVNHQKLLYIRNYFKKRILEELEDIRFNGMQEDHFLAQVLSVPFPPGPKADFLVMNLDIAGISASSGSACSSGVESDSHVLTAIGHPSERKTIRFSFSIFNTKEEVDFTIEQLKKVSTGN
jgi:cysteine desulfurase